MNVFLILVLAAVAVVLIVIAVNTARFGSRQVAVGPVPEIEIDGDAVAKRLSKAVCFRTVSYQDPDRFEPGEFLGFHKFLEESFPAAHATLRKEVVNGYSLLYTWQGSDESLKPLVFMAHMDVVPVAEGTEGDWTHPPFSGQVADGYIWGRGAIDDKFSLMGLMEAVEHLAGEGYKPRRTIYFAFGHDEEIGGRDGAARIVELLEAREVKAEYILDEAGFVTRGMMPGVSAPVGLIGIAEKGYLTLELEVEDEGGHSSMPPPQSAIGVLAAAIRNLEKNPFPAVMSGPSMKTFDYIGPEMSMPMRAVFANRRLFKPLLRRVMEKTKNTNAAIRTTIAVTIVEAGDKENVLPRRARAVVNFRLLPGQSIEGVFEHVKKAVKDPRVRIRQYGDWANEASAVSSVDSYGYRILELTVREMYPEAVVAPFLMIATSDARHYQKVSDSIVRFFPVSMGAGDVSRIHGVNERIGYDDYTQGVRFYIRLIRNSS